MGRRWYLIWAAVGLLVGAGVAWCLEPGTAAGYGILGAFGALGGLLAGFMAAAFVPLVTESYQWIGVSGRSYDYAIHDLYVKFVEGQFLPGNFAFVKTVDDVSCPLFFGETPNGAELQPRHHVAWDEAVRLGATHIHWHGNRDAAARLQEVGDLVAKYAPPLNDQLTGSG